MVLNIETVFRLRIKWSIPVIFILRIYFGIFIPLFFEEFLDNVLFSTSESSHCPGNCRSNPFEYFLLILTFTCYFGNLSTNVTDKRIDIS